MWNITVELGNETQTITNDEPIRSTSYRTIYANKKSVKQSEFYAAAVVGLKPELVFEVYSFEFNNDELLRYNGKEYSIVRAYEKGEITELIVTSQTGTVI